MEYRFELLFPKSYSGLLGEYRSELIELVNEETKATVYHYVHSLRNEALGDGERLIWFLAAIGRLHMETKKDSYNFLAMEPISYSRPKEMVN